MHQDFTCRASVHGILTVVQEILAAQGKKLASPHLFYPSIPYQPTHPAKINAVHVGHKQFLKINSAHVQ